MATQQIFGGNNVGNPTQTAIAVLGSTAAGSPSFSTDPTTLQNTNWLNGLSAVDFVRNPLPAVIPDWNAGTTYNTGDYAKDTLTTLIYQSKVNGNINNALSDTNFWLPAGTIFTPYEETINSLAYVLSNNIAEIQRAGGILDWNATTPYIIGALVKDSGTSNVYLSQIGTSGTPNLGNSLTNTTAWFSCGSIKNLQQANTTTQGTMRIATQTEVNNGTNNTIAVTPLTLNNYIQNIVPSNLIYLTMGVIANSPQTLIAQADNNSASGNGLGSSWLERLLVSEIDGPYNANTLIVDRPLVTVPKQSILIPVTGRFSITINFRGKYIAGTGGVPWNNFGLFILSIGDPGSSPDPIMNGVRCPAPMITLTNGASPSNGPYLAGTFSWTGTIPAGTFVTPYFSDVWSASGTQFNISNSTTATTNGIYLGYNALTLQQLS